MENQVLNTEQQPTLNNQRDMTLWQRLVGVIANPGDTMTAIATKPTILWPMVMVIFANVAVFLMTVPKLKEFLLITFEKLPKQQMPPEQIAALKSYMAGNTAVLISGVSIVVIPLVAWLVYTLIFKLVNLFIGSEAPFKSLYAVSIMSSVPSVLGSLLRSILIAISPGKDLGYISTSAAVLLPKGEIGPLFTFLSNIDPFRIWSLALLAIGAAAVLRTSAKKMGIVAAVLWLLMTAASVLMSLLAPQNPGA
ncbi:MAG TPA: YIP1 family protein [Bacillota bacterium]|nr:YIP1 family protein [Bacillota bacterium]